MKSGDDEKGEFSQIYKLRNCSSSPCRSTPFWNLVIPFFFFLEGMVKIKVPSSFSNSGDKHVIFCNILECDETNAIMQIIAMTIMSHQKVTNNQNVIIGLVCAGLVCDGTVKLHNR